MKHGSQCAVEELAMEAMMLTRKTLNLTQAQFGERLGMSRDAIASRETARVVWTIGQYRAGADLREKARSTLLECADMLVRSERLSDLQIRVHPRPSAVNSVST